ncbi:MAG: nucleoside hydrolase [Pseudomonadota bacterium]
MTRPIIIDCDPGQDDAVNLLMALAVPKELDVLGITAVAGNVPLPLTERNARLMCELAGRHDVPVFAGGERPLVRSLVTAENVHGNTGIDGVDIHTPSVPLQATHATDFIVDTLRAAADDSTTLVPTGPLTNVAHALIKAPDIAPKIREIVIMGGAMREGGNHSPSAEFNMLVDPHAARVVFECGRPLTVFGLDVTHQVPTTPARLEQINAIGNPVASAVHAMLSFYSRFDSAKYGTTGAPLHDPCTVAYLLQPDLFEFRHVNLRIETESAITMGHTAVDFWHVTGLEHNARWAHGVDADGFYALLNRLLETYS